MFSFCVDQVSRMEYNPEGEHCGCKKSKEDGGGGDAENNHGEEESRTKKVSSPAALGSLHGQADSKNSHFFGRTKKVSAPPAAQFEALLAAACHFRVTERERKRSAVDPATAHQQSSPHRYHLKVHNHHTSNHSVEDHDGNHGDPPIPPQRKASDGNRKERKKGSAMAPPTLDQLHTAVLEEAAKHAEVMGRKSPSIAPQISIFGRAKKVSAPPVAQFEALLAAHKKREEDRERKRSAHSTPDHQSQHHHHHLFQKHQQPHHHNHHHLNGQLVHHIQAFRSNEHSHPPHHPDLPQPIVPQRRVTAIGISAHKKISTGSPIQGDTLHGIVGLEKGQGEDHRHRKRSNLSHPDLGLDGIWMSRCGGEGKRELTKTPAELMAHELDSALAAVAQRRKEGQARKKSGLKPAEALAAEMDSALAAALQKREQKINRAEAPHKNWRPPTPPRRSSNLNCSLEMLSRG